MENKINLPVKHTELDKLKEIANRLSFAELVQGQVDGFAVYECDKGTCFGQSLLHTDDIAVSNTFASVGTEFAQHVHCVLEIVIVYQGKMVLSTNGDVIEVGEKENIIIKPNMPHSAFFSTDTWMICMTIPADENYP